MDTNCGRRNLSTLARSMTLVLALITHSNGGFAAEPLPVADLEQGFWVCDYLATTHGMDATPVDLCSAITDELKTRKFGGDYEGLVGWWRQHKIVEHQRLEAADPLKNGISNTASQAQR